MVPVPFAELLRELRKKRGLTQYELAERAGCSESAIRKFETDKRRPSAQVAALLADALGITGRERSDFLPAARGITPAGDADFTPPTNLLSQLTSLVGRDAEIEKLFSLLLREDVRLVTVVGPPGIGKTRLALETALRLLAEFEDGAFLVTLAPVQDPSQVLPAIARVLNIRDTGREPVSIALKDHLKNKRLLLVLDNFEQVIEAAKPVVDLLGQSPGIKVLVTSRELLHVRGERHFSVLPLALPEPAHSLLPSELYQYSAVRLFADRAQEALPDFELDDENAEAVSQICAYVDGLPLGIELVAARVRLLPPGALLTRLRSRIAGRSDSLAVLSGGTRDLPARHRTLRDAIGWSYDLLSTDDRRLFSRLGVFNGGWTLLSAEAICNAQGDLAQPILDGVTSLLDKHLIRKEVADREQGEGEPRVSMLETIREYASEKLEEQGEANVVRRWHAEYFLVLAQATEPQLVGPQQQVWLNRLEADHENLRSALNWLVEQGEVETAGKLAGALHRFWMVHGHLSEGRRWLDRIVALGDRIQPATRAKALNGAGVLARTQGDYTASRVLMEECLAIYKEIGDKPGIAVALKDLGTAYDYLGDLETASRLYREGAEAYREIEDRWGLAGCLSNLGTMEMIQGRAVEGKSLYREALELYRAIGDRGGVGRTLNNLAFALYQEHEYVSAAAIWQESLMLLEEMGERASIGVVVSQLSQISLLLGDLDQALELCERSLNIHKGLGDRQGIARALNFLGEIYIARGEFAKAGEMLHQCLILLKEISAKLSILSALESYAKLKVAMGEYRKAVQIYGAVASGREAARMVLTEQDSAGPAQNLNMARSHLSEEEGETLWQYGLAMSLDDAMTLALQTE